MSVRMYLFSLWLNLLDDLLLINLSLLDNRCSIGYIWLKDLSITVSVENFVVVGLGADWTLSLRDLGPTSGKWSTCCRCHGERWVVPTRNDFVVV